jgi:hypothetical protein
MGVKTSKTKDLGREWTDDRGYSDKHEDTEV